MRKRAVLIPLLTLASLLSACGDTPKAIDPSVGIDTTDSPDSSGPTASNPPPQPGTPTTPRDDAPIASAPTTDTPAAPAVPSVPDAPGNTPAAPGTPDTPAAPEVPDTPSVPTPDQPATPDQAAVSAPAVDVLIPRVDPAQAPVIDGVPRSPGEPGGEWTRAVQLDTRGNPLLINHLMLGSAADGSAEVHRWAAVHDGTYLYLLVYSDDAGRHSYDTQEARKPWKDDDLEVYIDGNNSKLHDYDGVDDFHWHVDLIDPGTGGANKSTSLTRRIVQAPRSATLPADIDFATGLSTGPVAIDGSGSTRDVYEQRVLISELNIAISQPFGIEVQLNDDDDGGGRDRKWGWRHPVGVPGADDLTWQDPSYMGTAILQR